MKKIFIRFLSVLLALQGYAGISLLTAPSAYASEMPDVIINEVMWMGSTAPSGSEDEWVELYNTTQDPIDLSSWVLANVKTAGSGSDYTVPASTSIGSNSYLLIGQAGLGSTIRSVPLDLEVTNFSLSNPISCRVITLKDEADVAVDSMGCNGDGTYFGGENSATKRSLERNVVIGAGTDESNWHSSIGFANLDPTAAPDNFATPAFVNDGTTPLGGVVNDGLVDDINWTTDTTTASANWNGFADSESGVVGYSVGLGTSIGSDDVVAFADVALATSYVFPLGAGLTEGTTYFATVRATNGVGLASTLSSDGFTVDTAAPAPVTNLTISDVPGDNGGNVTVDWDPSTSVDEIAYRVDYHQVGGGGALSVLVGSATTANISGLENSPVEYEFEVVVIDFSTLESVGNPTVTGSALDNLAPELSSTKVAVAQNQPGTSDTISGIGGAASEPATVMVFDRDPSNPVKTTIASVATEANGGFVRVSLGDNLYGSVWVQLVDSAGNASTAKKFVNDIVGPAAPVITKATSTCFTERCQVELRWTGDNSDTDHYVIKYGSGVQVKTSLPVEGNSLVLDLPVDGSFQSFTVVAFDQFGNSTAAVKSFKASLVAGVVTTATLINGRLVTATSALPGSKETVTMDSPPMPAKLVPSAHAAEPDLDQTGDTEAAGDQDWLRIAIVVIILLIVASGFYSLSRSMGKNQLDIPAKPVKKKSGTSTKKPVGSNRQRHRKPKRK